MSVHHDKSRVVSSGQLRAASPALVSSEQIRKSRLVSSGLCRPPNHVMLVHHDKSRVVSFGHRIAASPASVMPKLPDIFRDVSMGHCKLFNPASVMPEFVKRASIAAGTGVLRARRP